MIAAKRLALGQLWQGFISGSEQRPDTLAFFHRSAAEPPVMPHARKPFGQDMNEPASNKFPRSKSQNGSLPSDAGGPLE